MKQNRNAAAFSLALGAMTLGALVTSAAPPHHGPGGPPHGTPQPKGTCPPHGTPAPKPTAAPTAEPTAEPTPEVTPDPYPTVDPVATVAPIATVAPVATVAPPLNLGGATPEIRLLQSALGRVLTDAEKADIKAAAVVRNAALKNARHAFQVDIAAIFGLTPEELGVKIRAYLALNPAACHDSLELLLTGAVGDSLTDEQKAAIHAAIVKRDVAIHAALLAYRTSVAAAVGLTLAELDAKVGACLKSQHGHGGHR